MSERFYFPWGTSCIKHLNPIKKSFKNEYFDNIENKDRSSVLIVRFIAGL